MAARITTTANVKTYLGITGSSHDALILQLVERVEAAFEAETRRAIAQVSITNERHSGHGRALELILREWPIDTVSVTLDGTALAADEFDVAQDPESGKVYYTPNGDSKPVPWPAGNWNVVVDYDGGYASADVPADILNGITEAVAWLYKKTEPGGDHLTERSATGLDGVTQTFLVDAWPPNFERLIAKYRRYDFGG